MRRRSGCQIPDLVVGSKSGHGSELSNESWPDTTRRGGHGSDSSRVRELGLDLGFLGVILYVSVSLSVSVDRDRELWVDNYGYGSGWTRERIVLCPLTQDTAGSGVDTGVSVPGNECDC